MPSTRITAIDICAYRMAKLTEAGAPSAGTQNGYGSNAVVSTQVKTVTEKGDDLSQKNGCGLLQAVYRTPDQLKSLDLTVVLNQLDVYALHLATGADAFVDSGTGLAFGGQSAAVGTSPGPISYEYWVKAWEGDHQLASELTDPDATWIHFVNPFTRWSEGDRTYEHALLTVPINGVASENPNMPTDGPFGDWPARAVAVGGITRLGGWFFDGPPPDMTDGEWITVPA